MGPNIGPCVWGGGQVRGSWGVPGGIVAAVLVMWLLQGASPALRAVHPYIFAVRFENDQTWSISVVLGHILFLRRKSASTAYRR